jgi:molybdopterin converting factor small subunit
MSEPAGKQTAQTETSVEVNCTGHVRTAVGDSRMDVTFDGTTLRDFLDTFCETHDVEELLIAETADDATTDGWAPGPEPEELPGTWEKNPDGEQTRCYARVTVNGTFNEHLDGLHTELEDGDRVGLMYPFIFCC